jgi:hypothetical protein
VLPFVLAFFMVVGILLTIASFIAWAVREHMTAKKYRYLIRLHNAMPPAHIVNKVEGPTWRFLYKIKGGTENVDISAKTEGEAIQKFMATKRDYAKVVTFEKL